MNKKAGLTAAQQALKALFVRTPRIDRSRVSTSADLTPAFIHEVLTSGQAPVLVDDGRWVLADHDQRYTRLAVAVGLDPGLVTAAALAVQCEAGAVAGLIPSTVVETDDTPFTKALWQVIGKLVRSDPTLRLREPEVYAFVLRLIAVNDSLSRFFDLDSALRSITSWAGDQEHFCDLLHTKMSGLNLPKDRINPLCDIIDGLRSIARGRIHHRSGT